MLSTLLCLTRRSPQPLVRIAGMATAATPDLSGIFPPIVTPFNKDESIAWDKLGHNMEQWNKHPLAGFLVHGSNGEFCYLNTEERVEVIKAVKEQAGPGKLVLAGSGCESTLETIQVTKAMADAGADVAVVITPCYYKGKMTGPVLEAHYTAVADASPIPVVLYSVPANTAIDLPVETVARLARHDNIIGMKESGGDITKIGSMVHLTKGEDFQILAGSASFLLASHSVGAVGGICALANVLPGPVCELHHLCTEQRWQEAKILQHRLIAPNSAVTKIFGVPGLKESMGWFGYYGGPTRRPLVPLSEKESEALENSFTSEGFK